MVRRFARDGRVVVAGRTLSGRRRVIKPDRRPAGVYVAIFADICRRQMRRRLAGRDCPVVTGQAIARYPGMVKADIRPLRRRMTLIAVRRGLDVDDRLAG